MHLRHIDPRSTDWMDAMVDEGKAETDSEVEAKGESAPLLAATESATGEARSALTSGPPR